MKIKTFKKNVDANVLWDAGSTTSLITFKKAREMHLKGQNITLSIVKLGGELEDIESFAYDLLLMDSSGIQSVWYRRNILTSPTIRPD